MRIGRARARPGRRPRLAPLRVAVVASAAGHVLVFAAVALTRQDEPAPAWAEPAPLYWVRLAAPAPRAVPDRRGEAPGRVAAPGRPAPTPRLPPAVPAAAADPASPRAPSPGASTPQTAPPRAPQPPVAAPRAPSDEPAASALEAYGRLVWARIAAARPAGLHREGEAEVAFRLDRAGRLREVGLLRSSGDRGLDVLALRAVRLAAPFPAPPAELDEAQLSFTAPVRFH